MRARFFLLLLVVPAFAAPGGIAHGAETVAQGAAVTIGPLNVYLTPNPSPIYANASNQGLIMEATHLTEGGYVTDYEAQVQVAGVRGLATFEAFDARKRIARVSFPEPGEIGLRLIVTYDGEDFFNNTMVTVFPELGFRLRAVDPVSEFESGRAVVFAYETVHPVTGERIDPLEDLSMRVEERSATHLQILGTEDLEMTRASPGLWRVSHTFDHQGHFYLRFASRGAGFNYTDVPLLHINVHEPVPSAAKQTPGASVASVALAAVALAFALRRR